MKQQLRLSIQGMGCASCVGKVEAQLQGVQGLLDARINLADRTAYIEAEMDVSADDLIQAIASAGAYQATILHDENDQKQKIALEQHHLQQRIHQSMVAGISGFLLMLGSMLEVLPALSEQAFWLAIGLMTCVLMWYAGGHFFSSAWRSLQHRHSNMDTLVALGTAVAWLYSMLVVVWPAGLPTASQFVYFEAALIVISLVNVGHVLEAKARGKTNQTIQKLLGLQVKTARLLQHGQEMDVPLDQVQLGDVIRVRPGEKIPMDG
ncbi:MAG: cation transporter, partial [Mariprofundaceae bacterium]|nr:cation transporter [Mariprofundaceae bacterium]